MNKKRYFSIIISVLLGLSINFFITIPSGRTDQEIPTIFSQQLQLNNTYSYNVTQFGGDLNWLGFDFNSKYNVSTNSGGKILVNFTSFHDKDPNDIFNAFGSPMPFMNVEFVRKELNTLLSNHTFYNVSNGEAAFNMVLGYNAFQSGFLIPINNLTDLKDLALAQDSGFMTGIITIKENDNVLLFDFKQDSGFQNTSLIYDKHTGLLVSVTTELLPISNPIGYKLEMVMTNYTLDLNFPPEQKIPSFPIIIMLSIVGISNMAILLRLKRKIKLKS
jgi:hypothetical protein